MFVVTMFRQGPNQDRFETHSYVLGVFYTRQQAVFQANVEMLARTGKYDAWLDFCVAGSVDEPHSYTEDQLGWIEYQYSEEVELEVKRRYSRQENI
jgi:hypothetical protein